MACKISNGRLKKSKNLSYQLQISNFQKQQFKYSSVMKMNIHNAKKQKYTMQRNLIKKLGHKNGKKS